MRSRPSRADTVARAAGVALLGLAPPALVTARAWGSPATTWPGEAGDNYKFMSFLAWVPHALGTLQNPFWMRVIDYPLGVNLAWETPVPLGGVAMWPVLTAFGPVVAYNVFIFVTLALDVACSFLWLRRHVRRGWAAAIPSVLFGLGPWIGVHVVHPNLVAFWPIPLLFMAVEDALAARPAKLRRGVVAGLLVAVQLYLAEELVAIAAIGIAVVLATAALVRPRRRADWRGLVLSGGAAAVVFAVLAAPMLLLQFLGPRAVHGTIQPANVFVADLQNFVLPTRKSWLWPVSPKAADGWTGIGEATAFVGLPLLVAAATIAWLRREEPLVQLVTLATLIVAGLSLGPHLHVSGNDTGVRLPAAVLARLPLLDNLLPVRLSLLTDFGIALLAALAIDAAAAVRRPAAVVAGGFAVVGVVAALSAVPVAASTAPIPAYFARGGPASRLPRGTVALVGPYIIDGRESAVPMLWQAESGFSFTMIEGFAITVNRDGHPTWLPDNPVKSAFQQIQAGGVTPPETDAARGQLLAELRARGVNLVVLGPMPHRDEAVKFVTWLLGRPPEVTGGVELWSGLPPGA